MRVIFQNVNIYLDLTEVELKFLTLEDVTITTTRLTRTRSNDGVETTGIELIVQERIDSRGSGTSSNLLFDTLGLLLSRGFLLIL
jgi:hypothetical protein